MRVPIAQSDLIPNCGFKLIARVLQQNWPASSPIGLMTSQEVLSQGLGYRDYHDLSQEAEKGTSSAAIPTPAEVADSIHTAVFAYLSREYASEISSDDVDKAVESLPLNQLKVFSAALGSGTPARPDEEATGLALPRYQPSAPEQSRLQDRSIRSLLASPEGQSSLELKCLWERVKQGGNLRDICLLGLTMFTGFRSLEIVGARVCKPAEAEHMISIPIHKARSAGLRYSPTTKGIGSWVKEYILKEGLQPGDYLFRSERNPQNHMTTSELRRTIWRWNREAKSVAEVLRIFHSLKVNQFDLELIHFMTGHVSTDTSRHYISGYEAPSDK